MKFLLPVAITIALFCSLRSSPAASGNTNEALAGSYTLPDPLVLLNGKPVQDARTWMNKRRPEILKLYRDHIHGYSPRPAKLSVDVWDIDRHALDGRAVRKQVDLRIAGHSNSPVMHLLLYTPANAQGPVPTFLCLHFSPNHRITKDPGVRIYPAWDRRNNVTYFPTNDARGTSHSWKIEETLARGYGIAAVQYHDIEPDWNDGTGWKQGVRALYRKPGQEKFGPAEWGAISAWAWGASRIMDYLVTDKEVDSKRVIMTGQSRLGKTALWAGAQDERFAMVIASCSGEMGAALSRRDFGETVTSMSRAFPYQFCGNFVTYSNRISEMPVDAHLLISLIAPRPLYLSTGSEDLWSDPRGEFLAAQAASPVWRLFGRQGLDGDPYPPLDTAIMHDIGFSCHTGRHDIIPADWDRFLDFADKHLR